MQWMQPALTSSESFRSPGNGKDVPDYTGRLRLGARQMTPIVPLEQHAPTQLAKLANIHGPSCQQSSSPSAMFLDVFNPRKTDDPSWLSHDASRLAARTLHLSAPRRQQRRLRRLSTCCYSYRCCYSDGLV